MVHNSELLCNRLQEGTYIANTESTCDVDTQNQLIQDLLINACQLQIHIRMKEIQTAILSMDQLINIMQQHQAIFAASHTMLDLVQNDS